MPVEPEVALLEREQLDALSSTFAPPRWLRDLGLTSWFLLGFLVLLGALTWLLGATATIVGPVVGATIVATVVAPIVSALHRHHVPRAAGAALVLLGMIALVVVVVLVVVSGITAQSDSIAKYAHAAAGRAEQWLESAGVDQSGATRTEGNVSAAVPHIIATFTKGIVGGIQGVASLAFAMSFATLSLFFLLKDGPSLRKWIDHHLAVSPPVAHVITSRLIGSVRGYFRGVATVAAFNGVVVAIGALIVDVPLAGTIGVVTFVTAFIPYIGAVVAGGFAVVIALGANGTSTALIMLVIVLLANGLLQNVVQPFAMGSALGLHPLVVLLITVGAGCILGMFGLILAAPLASAGRHIAHDLARARERALATEGAGALNSTAPI
jgi:putative heme transporter